MAIFELDGGRSSLVQPMRPRADSFEAESSTLVADHVSDLLGEQVLTVREGGSGGPHLLALDAGARPVVVEVAQLLDAAGLVRALRHAGGAARLSRADLARMYHGGRDAFEADLAVFRDRAPFLQAQAPARTGARLVVVCADVAEDVADAVDHVTANGDVEVLRVGVTQGPGGRRYLEVSPLTWAPGQRRAVEPGPRTGAVPAVRSAEQPAPARVSVPQRRPAAVTDPTPVVPAGVPQPAADGHGPHRHAAPAPAAESERPGARADETTLMAPVTDAGPDDAGEHHRHAQGTAPLPELAALAAAERQAMELVWLRVRRGQRLVATLRADGLIELPDGSVHADPDTAASVAADLERPTDGWRVWRFGDDGPTLGEGVGRAG
jgi:hypothetical protein